MERPKYYLIKFYSQMISRTNRIKYIYVREKIFLSWRNDIYKGRASLTTCRNGDNQFRFILHENIYHFSKIVCIIISISIHVGDCWKFCNYSRTIFLNFGPNYLQVIRIFTCSILYGCVASNKSFVMTYYTSKVIEK